MSQPADAAAETSNATLLRMALGYQLTQLLAVAANLGIADLLTEGPRLPAELAAVTGTHAPALYRFLRALASHGVFAEDESGRFALTALAEPLQSGVPASVREPIMSIRTQSYRLWGDLLHSVQTGETAFEHIFGMTNWQYRAEHPEANASFNEVMARGAQRRGRALGAVYDFPSGATVADIGGGVGTLLTTILAANTSLRGILVDRTW